MVRVGGVLRSLCFGLIRLLHPGAESKHFHFPDTNTGTIQVLGEVVCDEGLVSGAPQGAPQELAGGRTHRGSDGRGRDV